MAAPHLIVPIFPLPDVTFFPHTLLPLHVFEARYRVLVIDEATYAGKPEVHAVAGLGEIVSCERLATGRYNILLRGECRVRLGPELPSDTLYRLVRARRLADADPAGDVTAALSRMRAACKDLLGALGRPADLLDTALAEGQPAGAITDRVAAAVLPDADLRQRLLETIDVGARVTTVADAVERLVKELKGGRE